MFNEAFNSDETVGFVYLLVNEIFRIVQNFGLLSFLLYIYCKRGLSSLLANTPTEYE